MSLIAFFDIETSQKSNQIVDMGCALSDGSVFHENEPGKFERFIEKADFLCGHNIVSHDLVYLQEHFKDNSWGMDKAIDTLLLSPLLFPQNPYHRLLKDDKLHRDELNNPLNDSLKARELFFDEVEAFQQLDDSFKEILYQLLSNQAGIDNFFKYIHYYGTAKNGQLPAIIQTKFRGNICANSDLESFIKTDRLSLAYALALLHANDKCSVTPGWVLHNYPQVERFFFSLRNQPCIAGCSYCKRALDPLRALKKHYRLSSFRTYSNEPLQENAVNAAIHGQSILAVFPTGGGKSITFQLPALMSGKNAKALTVVISPLQSLMKDQVDNLEKEGIIEAVTINGLLNAVDRGKAIERIENGSASLLYIAPESLRSIAIERLLLKRKIARFVIDEAHCFSSWGQDFRVDYLYIGDFIKSLQEKKKLGYTIPVSCFTATARQKVIEDIYAYFKEKLNLSLTVFRANTSRTNLQYHVYPEKGEDDKYNRLRTIIEAKKCPTIVYVSRTKSAYKLAQRLSSDGFIAKPYHGKMEKAEKSKNQDAFKSGEVNIIVATSAFGMGVDKSDVGAVIHFDISGSLENYVQEAGRAGRDENIHADCYILFNEEEDLGKHFTLLNQTKVSIKEINQVWKAIKGLTKTRDTATNSALEIARKAGWDDSTNEIETRVITAIASLENAGYLRRGQNMPRIFASSILSKNAQEAIDKINTSERITDEQKTHATRIIKKLFSSKSKMLSTDEQAESRVDYIADQLGIAKKEVIRIIEFMREEKILENKTDLIAYIKRSESVNRSLSIVENFRKQEELLLSSLKEGKVAYHLKELVELFIQSGITGSSLNTLKTILNFWSIKKWIKYQHLEYTKSHLQIALLEDNDAFREKQEKRHFLARKITEYLYRKAAENAKSNNKKEDEQVDFSVHELKEMIEKEQGMFSLQASIEDIEDSLFYLSKIEAIKIEGGFLVIYNSLTVCRLQKNSRVQYKESDYEKLKQFYQQKVQQIHIVGEYAKKLRHNYREAQLFADDYFRLNHSSFLSKYFPGSRQEEIKRPLTPEKFRQLFKSLSEAQSKIISDSTSPYIVVAAGPGSGKTKLLVHKLASLLLAEEVKQEQLLMLTFSRAAATEFKRQLIGLIGNIACNIDIKTFHSYCFDILGRVGNLPEAEEIIPATVERIRSAEVEISKITKTALVVDEAQDMDEDEYELINALMEQNEDMRVILVGDDDQSIYDFRGANAAYMQKLITEKSAEKYELARNYRSKENIVSLANKWASTISNRLKTEPCFASQQQNGTIQITAYTHPHIIVPLAEIVRQAPLTGSTCVLTATNEEAMLLSGLLLQYGLPARLIQSNESFNLRNLYELRYFSDIINANTSSPLITDNDWETAKHRLNEHIHTSTQKELANAVIGAFEDVNRLNKYKSDWNTFLAESSMEDFLHIDAETIYVSTIHKAKGKEFDNVYLLLENFSTETDENKRLFYVAITRAKSSLYIHYHGKYLKSYSIEGLTYNEDRNAYPQPQQIALCLTHEDVYLDYFDYVRRRTEHIVSGAALCIMDGGLGNAEGELVLKYAQKFKKILERYAEKGFIPVAATVNFVVYWKSVDNGTESRILLPRLLLKKQ